jgi:hypothetical protein
MSLNGWRDLVETHSYTSNMHAECPAQLPSNSLRSTPHHVLSNPCVGLCQLVWCILITSSIHSANMPSTHYKFHNLAHAHHACSRVLPQVTASFVGVTFPKGQRLVSRDVPGVTKASMVMSLADVGAGMEAPVSYTLRYNRSQEEGGVVADRYVSLGGGGLCCN